MLHIVGSCYKRTSPTKTKLKTGSIWAGLLGFINVYILSSKEYSSGKRNGIEWKALFMFAFVSKGDDFTSLFS